MEKETREEGGGEGLAVGVLDIVLLTVVVLAVVVLVLRWRRKGKTKEMLKRVSVPNLTLGRPIETLAGVGGNFLDRMKTSNKKVVVFFGSQTGTAEEFAQRLAKDATRHGLPAMTFDPEECTDWEDLTKLGSEVENALAIFCVATYGEGEPTDNAQEFYDWLKTGGVDLSSLKFAVFALGNKTYEHYNLMGRFVDKQLAELGAHRVYERGEGDDDGSIEEDFVTWTERFWPAVCQHFGIDTTQLEGNLREYSLTLHTDIPPERVFMGEPHRLGSFSNQKPPYNAKNPYLAPVRVIRELHTGGDRSCMHVEMDISDSRLNYVAGDHMAIFPVNNPQHVERIGELLDIDLDTVFSLTCIDETASKKHPFPCPTTYRTALSYYVDILSPPRTNVLRELAEFASDPNERNFLLKITSPTEEGKHEYHEWIVHDRRTLMAVLEDLPSFKPPIDYLLELLPRLQARYYSISSSPKLHPTSIHITAVLVEYTTGSKRTNRGVTTSWLKRLQASVQNGGPTVYVPIYVRHSSLRLPYHTTKPVIMVGPGTGLAPFRGFIQERAAAKQAGKELGDTILFFGCRHKSEDYIYQEELEGYHGDGVLSQLHVAFSRDQPEKVYVQHLLKQSAKSVWSLLEKQGYFYVCGDARHMARDVQNALLGLIQEEGGMDEQAAGDYVKKLQKRNRYLQDVWS